MDVILIIGGVLIAFACLTLLAHERQRRLIQDESQARIAAAVQANTTPTKQAVAASQIRRAA